MRRRAAMVVGIALALAAAVLLVSHIPRTLTVFLIAAAIALALAPVVGWLERRMPRIAAIGIVYLALCILTIVLVLAVVPATLLQVQSIAANVPDYINVVQGWIDSTQRFLMEHGGKNYLPSNSTDLHGLVADRVEVVAAILVASVSNILIGTFTAAFIGISSLILSAFFLIRGASVADSLYLILPESRRAPARELGTEMAGVFGSYVIGQLVLCTLTGAMIFVATYAAGFKFALLLGIVGGIAYAVPFVGMVFAHVIALVLAAPQGLATVLWVQGIVFTIARVSDNLLVPKIMSESVGVSPIVVMFAVFAGGELFGLPGLLLGIPAAAIAKVLWRFFRAQATGGRVEPSPAGSIAPVPAAEGPTLVTPAASLSQ